MKKSMKLLFVLLTLVAVAACGGGTTSPEDDGDGDNTTASTAIFPYDLVISSPFASEASAQQPSQNKSFDLVLDVTEDNQDYTTKKEELASILEGDSIASCGFNMTLFAGNGNAVNCYGSSLAYIGHPEATPEDGNSGGGDRGIWDESNTDGEACAAAQTGAMVDAVSGAVDTAVSSFAAMLCVIRNTDGLSVPDAGADALDVATALQNALEANDITELTVTTATLEHQADDADGNDVYFFTLTGSATYEGNTRNITLYLKHIPLNEDNTLYKGKLSYAFTDDAGLDDPDYFVGNCYDASTVGEENKVRSMVEAGSVLYHKKLEELGESEEPGIRLTYRLQTGKFCDSSHMPLDVGEDGNYDIDLADSATPENPTGYANGLKYYLFKMNPEDETGDFAFAWAAGTGSENLRTLNLSIAELPDSAGKGGCAYFGYGPTAAEEDAVLGDIDGFVCNWGINGSGEQPFRDYVQRQCVSYDDATGKYVTDETLGDLSIGYAPTSTCTTPAGNEFTYHASDNSTEEDPATNDRYDDEEAVAIGLAPIAERDFTVPEVPDDVY